MKNPIAIAVSNLTSLKETLETGIQSAGYNDRRERESQFTLVTGLLRAIDNLIEAPFVSPSNFTWEFDGGDAQSTTPVAIAAMGSIYFHTFHAWKRENSGPTFPLFDMPDDDDDSMWFNSERQHISPTLEEMKLVAGAIYSYCLHLSRYPGLAWLTGFNTTGRDGKSITVRLVLPFDAWCIQRVAEVPSGQSEYFRMCAKEVGSLRMPLDEAKEVLKDWLQQPGADDLYRDKGERIVARAADNQAIKLLNFLTSPSFVNLKQAYNKLGLWELLLCSEYLNKVVRNFKTSPEYQEKLQLARLEKLEKRAQQLEQLKTRAEREAKLAQRERELEEKIEALLKNLPSNPSSEVLLKM